MSLMPLIDSTARPLRGAAYALRPALHRSRRADGNALKRVVATGLMGVQEGGRARIFAALARRHANASPRPRARGPAREGEAKVGSERESEEAWRVQAAANQPSAASSASSPPSGRPRICSA